MPKAKGRRGNERSGSRAYGGEKIKHARPVGYAEPGRKGGESCGERGNW